MGKLAAGRVHLYTPGDWFDLLADSPDREATRSRCAELVRLTYPDVAATRRAEFTDALLQWHDTLYADGVLMYGIITAPLPSTGAQAAWQIYAGVVEVPDNPSDLDLGELMTKLFAENYHAAPSYTEAYTTDMGMGFGFVAQPFLPVPEGPGPVPEGPGHVPEGLGEGVGVPSVPIGLAGALACPSEGGRGLLVIGTSLAADQAWELAGLVAVIGGRSVFADSQ
ncbi:hypothetical protein ABT381_22810 [Streptomyces sp. NPDC000151]|uniref:hypothetical protein n=1 Tax=Streptomyces sp. NPDC000151 TaxID=3154244 RepID=UPI00332415A0